MTYIQENREAVTQRHVCSSLMKRVWWLLTSTKDSYFTQTAAFSTGNPRFQELTLKSHSSSHQTEVTMYSLSLGQFSPLKLVWFKITITRMLLKNSMKMF